MECPGNMWWDVFPCRGARCQAALRVVLGGERAVRVVGPDGYWVSDDKSTIDVPWVHAWMSRESYWAAGPVLCGDGLLDRAVAGAGALCS
jgi:hypothetical protein